MKTINLPPLFFLSNPLRAVSNNSSAADKQNVTPYLKAILSGSARSSVPSNTEPVANNDKEAALRYIKESTRLKK